MPEEPRLAPADAVRAVRSELTAAVQQGQGESLRFGLAEVEMGFLLEVQREVSPRAGGEVLRANTRRGVSMTKMIDGRLRGGLDGTSTLIVAGLALTGLALAACSQNQQTFVEVDDPVVIGAIEQILSTTDDVLQRPGSLEPVVVDGVKHLSFGDALGRIVGREYVDQQGVVYHHETHYPTEANEDGVLSPDEADSLSCSITATPQARAANPEIQLGASTFQPGRDGGWAREVLPESDPVGPPEYCLLVLHAIRGAGSPA